MKTGPWAWLSDSKTQRTLGFVGGGIAAVTVAGWQLYLHFSAEKPVAPPQPVVIVQPGTIDPAQAEKVVCAEAAATDALAAKLGGIADAISTGDSSQLQKSASPGAAKPCPPTESIPARSPASR
jgi:hypothetical protein